MLTVEHAKLRRKGGIVEVVPLCGLSPESARAVAEVAIDIVRAHEGAARAELEEALDALPLDPKEVRFGRGLKKLALDACDFDVDSEIPPEELRTAVFAAAAEARRAGTFERAAVLASVAAERGVTNEHVERALFADLSAAHAVKGFDVVDADDMIERYRVGELQAVLLRATRLVADLLASPAELRAVLRAAKLHQLLFDVDVLEGGVRLTLEGPMALFQQSTRYGLKLAVLLPTLLACRKHRIEATVRLRKHGAVERAVIAGTSSTAVEPGAADGRDGLGDVARALLDELAAKGGPWKARVAVDVLTLPGAGALVPDLELHNEDTGEIVYVEVLGFWSRAAVWKRVELVEKGLPYRVVFCASERLRVSEEALGDDATGALVVFKGTLKASKVLEAIERVARGAR